MTISEVVQLFISNKMVETKCPVHSIKICEGSSCVAPLCLSFGIKRKWVLNFKHYHFTVGWVVSGEGQDVLWEEKISCL